MTVPSKHTYGQRLSPEQKNRMDKWIDGLPFDWQLDDAKTARVATITVYEDWLHWSKPKALAWLAKLDKCERRYRIAGVTYHKIPYTLRHASSTAIHSSQIESTVLSRLTQIFEIDRPRSQQLFFRPWNELFDSADGVLEKLREAQATQSTPEDIDLLRILESGCEFTLSQLAKSLHNVETGLLWVEQQVTKLAERSNLDGSKSLAAKHSREGSLFRMWIQTFLEIEHAVVKSKSAYTEAFVDSVIGEEEIAKDPYWTMMAVGYDEGW